MGALNLSIPRGSTFKYVLRWGTDPIVYKPITAVPSLAPFRVTATAHGVPDGWAVALSDFVGMVEANAKYVPPRTSDFQKVKVVDVNTLEFNGVNASSFTPYISGGNVQYKTPVDLTGYTAALDFRARPDITLPALLSLTTTNGGIVLDNVAKTITLNITAAQTTTLLLVNATFDLEMLSPGGVRTNLLSGVANTVNESTV